jgi:hypothetical protein
LLLVLGFLEQPSDCQQIVQSTGNSAQTIINSPNGGYIGNDFVETWREATCIYPLRVDIIYVAAYLQQGCPNDIVSNMAHNDQISISIITANGLALDLSNSQVRGSIYDAKSCDTNIPAYEYEIDDKSVCGAPPLGDDMGGGDPNPAPILCFYGPIIDPDSNDGCSTSDSGISTLRNPLAILANKS